MTLQDELRLKADIAAIRREVEEIRAIMDGRRGCEYCAAPTTETDGAAAMTKRPPLRAEGDLHDPGGAVDSSVSNG